MNDNLRKLEKEFFISVYGEEEFEKLEKYMKTDLAKQRAKELEKMPYTKRPESIRAEIDRRNNLKQKDMENEINETAKVNVISKPEDDFIIDSNLDEDIYPIKNNLKEKNMEKFEDLFKNLEVQNDMTAKFELIANGLMNNFVIRANNKDFRLSEIEFYLYEKGKHEDNHIHSMVLANGNQNEPSLYQNKMANWYFHYSGIDLTFGDEKNRYGGILIRSIVSVNDGKEIKGPLKLKNYLLNQYNNICSCEEFLKLVLTDEKKSYKINLDNRIGLGKMGDAEFKNRQYRFVISK